MNKKEIKKLRKDIEKWGFKKKSTIDALLNLVIYCIEGKGLTPYQKSKWKKLDFMDKDGLVLLDTEAIEVELILAGLCWEGLVKRTKG